MLPFNLPTVHVQNNRTSRSNHHYLWRDDSCRCIFRAISAGQHFSLSARSGFAFACQLSGAFLKEVEPY
jgi:hypothetical protein